MKFQQDFISSLEQLIANEKDELIVSLTSTPPISVRTNPLKTQGQILEDKVDWASYGFYLSERPVFTLDPLFHAGAYYVQEASSMFLEHVVKQFVDLNYPITALDLCAAPGGKSTLLSSLLKPEDLLVCNEVMRPRADILLENIQKWGTGNTMVTRNDSASFSKIQEVFDLVILDAPCSGEGMFRKDPRAVEEWSLNNVKLCADRQKRILADVWSSLKPGGVLIYSTCTFNKEENEFIVQWALEEFQAENLKINIPSNWGVSPSLVPGISAARFFPHKIKGEGLFMAVLKKSGEQNFKKNKEKIGLKLVDKNLQPTLQAFTTIERATFINLHETIYAIHNSTLNTINQLIQDLYPIHLGVPIGTIKGKDLIPHPGLAFSSFLNKDNFHEYAVDRQMALSILAKETPNLETAEEGWNLITYEGLGLAWIKKMQNRINNYYPREWRIRMDFRSYEL